MIDGDEIFIDRSSYEQIWNVVIQPTIEKYALFFSDIVISDNAKEAIWQAYVELNRLCKMKYMQDQAGKIDRHKVCACYMYAIMKAYVMKCRLVSSDTEERYLALNENLAITVGMSLLRAFILASINSSESLSREEKVALKLRVEDGIIFPECNHGAYRENFVAELHYTYVEKNYNVLSLANTLFLLETHSLETEAVHKQTKKEKFAQEKRKKKKQIVKCYE